MDDYNVGNGTSSLQLTLTTVATAIIDAAVNSTAPDVRAHSHSSSPLLRIRQYARHLLPVFCCVGIIGNLMALTLIRSNYWLLRLTSNIYLSVLSLSGSCFLCTVFATWIDNAYGFRLYSGTAYGCKMITFAAHFCDFVCVWMISWISCDRMIVLYRPSFRSWLCTKTAARKITLGTIAVALALYGWCLLFAGLEMMPSAHGNVEFCGLNGNATLLGYTYNARQLYLSLMMVDTVICTIVPSVLIMVVNVFSIVRYHQCMKLFASGVLRVRFLRTPTSDVQIAESTTAKRLLLSNAGTCATNTLTSTATSSLAANCGKLRSSDLQLSRSLLVVTSTFVLLNVPNYLFRIYEYIFHVDGSDDVFSLLHFLSFLLYYLHHAVLFYMYIFWSPQMKKQLFPTALKLLECYCFKNVPEFGHERSTSMAGGFNNNNNRN